jgi:hypothetical protein
MCSVNHAEQQARLEFEALVAKSESGSSPPASLRGYDPVARAMKDTPTLTAKSESDGPNVRVLAPIWN